MVKIMIKWKNSLYLLQAILHLLIVKTLETNTAMESKGVAGGWTPIPDVWMRLTDGKGMLADYEANEKDGKGIPGDQEVSKPTVS